MKVRAKLFSLLSFALVADDVAEVEFVPGLERLRAWRAILPRDALRSDRLHERMRLDLVDGRTAEVFFCKFHGDAAVFRGVDPLHGEWTCTAASPLEGAMFSH